MVERDSVSSWGVGMLAWVDNHRYLMNLMRQMVSMMAIAR